MLEVIARIMLWCLLLPLIIGLIAAIGVVNLWDVWRKDKSGWWA